MYTATERQNEPPEDQRRSPRIRLKDTQVIVSWDEGSEHVTCDGEVLDISGGGAGLLVERAPPAGVFVRLQFGADSPGWNRWKLDLLQSLSTIPGDI